MKKPKVTREFLMPDGTVKAEHELTPEERERMVKKIWDVLIIPSLYDAVIRDLQQEEEVI